MTDQESRDQSDVSTEIATNETTQQELDNEADSKSAPEFPHKLRVHALARILGITSKEVIAHLAELGIAVRSPQSSIVRSAAVSVKARLAELADGEQADAEGSDKGSESDKQAQSDKADKASESDKQDAAQKQAAPAKSDATEPQPPVNEPSETAAQATQSHTSTLFSGVEVVTAPSAQSTAADAPPLFLQPEKVERPEGSSTSDDADADESSDDGEKSNDDRDSNSRRRRRGRRGRGRGRGDDGTDESQDSSDTEKASSGKAGEKQQGDKSGSDESESGKAGKAKGAKGSDKSKKADSTAGDSADKSDSDGSDSGDGSDEKDASNDSGSEESANSRRRRRRRRRKGGGDSDDNGNDDPPNTVVHEREPRSKRARDEVQGISGSTRLEAKRQRRRDGRDAGRRRPPILTESEFLARRESVDRVMVVREKARSSSTPEDYTQVAVLEDGVLVEHFVTTSASSSMVGNIYLGRVQNVLPGMEAAFVDIGRGRNGVLYAGEVNWDAAGLDGGSRKIEQALKPGDQVLVQVSKDPVGHKGARLTTQISLAGRYLVYVPGGSSTGISRKLPDVERKRLKSILSSIVPSDAGVIIRTASEGVSEEELTRDIERLKTQWNDIEAAVAADTKSGVPQSLYEEPELLIKVVRDLFNEDFSKLVVEGDIAADQVQRYVEKVAPDLMERVERFAKPHADAPDVFAAHRIDEQLTKALDRKVWLPSGGTLIIERTEAMTVVDVNTGKFTGSGGNLEETVTRNNLEAAEEIVRQMRLRDIGGMIVVDFIDMVLESNRDLVLRRLTEALGRDRTRHQVSEVTSLGLVQMTRKRLGTGLLEAFSTTCTCCQGRGVVVHANPVEVSASDENDSPKRGRRRRGKSGENSNTGNGNGNGNGGNDAATADAKPTQNPSEHPMFKAMASHGEDDDDAGASESADAQSSAEGDDGAPSGNDAPADQPRSRSRRSRGRRSGRREGSAPENGSDSDSSSDTDNRSNADDGRGSAEPVESTQTAPEPSTDAPADAQKEPAQVVQTESAPKGEAKADAAAARPKRRRVARGISTPVASQEPVTVSVPTEPVTTAGPSTPTSDGEPVVAVRRRPRGRAAGRPAGPPQE